MMIQKAVIDDYSELTELSLLSKAYWDYTPEQIISWIEDLRISPQFMEQNEVYKMAEAGKIFGFYALRPEDGGDQYRLGNLFVLPSSIGKGVGKRLLEHAFEQAKACGAKSIIVDSDPNAASFYAKFGFQVIGQLPTSIKGRFLPIMEKALD